MMQEQQVFEYAVIRVVPRVEREEFFNVGVIMFCARLKFLQCRFHTDEDKLRMFCGKLDVKELKGHITSFEKVCRGDADGGPISKLDIASRFRWLTATRSTILQPSRVHPGLTADPAKSFEKLFEQQVM